MIQNDNDIYKLLESNNEKIKILENYNQKNLKIRIFNIYSPTSEDNSKKFLGLLFNENNNLKKNFNNNETDIIKNKSFIKLNKNINLINYSISFKNNDKDNNSTCNIYIGIKDKKTNKINLLKGGRSTYNNRLIVDDNIIINYTTLYVSEINDELCILINLNTKFKIINDKSILRIINL